MEQPTPLRVLVVDDNRDAADALAQVLDLVGHSTHVCYDAPAAMLAGEFFRPDVCLLDLNMPGMNGLELAARLRVRLPHRPVLVIAVTALGTDADRQLTAVAGFDAHLVKPIDTTDLLLRLGAFARELTPARAGAGA